MKKLILIQKSALLIALIVIVDQVLKIWVKTNMHLEESFSMIGNWAKIHYTENPGMAFGLKYGGIYGKIGLSIFRIIAIAVLFRFIRKLIVRKAPTGFIMGIGLILAGAIGNTIDCAFYGLIFDTGKVFDPNYGWVGYQGISSFSSDGYAPFLVGNVVDMFYFPLMDSPTIPEWVPFFGGRDFTFFQHIFNLADAAITVGIIWLIAKQKTYFGKKEEVEARVESA